jgi:hypothetical protein
MMLNATMRSLAAGTVAVALTVWGVSALKSSESLSYQPRPEVSATQPDGAMEIRRMLVGDEEGNIDYEGLQSLRREVVKAAQKQAANKSNSLSWFELGPDNIGGRTRALVAVGSNTLYAGAVSGGLWKSTNRGDNWNQVVSFPSLMVGSIAVAGNGTIYVGTGSNFDGAGGEGGSGFRGDGIWMSTDNGASFSLVDGTDGYDATDAMIADPEQENRIWYASMDGYGSIVDGVLNEVPGGANSPSNAMDVAIAPDGSYCLVAGANGRVYRSVNGDFTNLEAITQGSGQNGNLPQSGIGRARIDIAQQANEDGTYNAFAMYATSGGLFYGLFFSDGAGTGGSWSEIWPGEIQTATPLPRSQGIYDLALGITKSDPTLAYVGGIEVWRSGPNQQAEQAAVAYDSPGFPFGVHADVHEILFVDDNTTHGVMYVATDGGIYRSEDNGYSYTACNRDYNVTQFYGMAHSAGTGVLGGTQDNGSLFIPGDGYFLSDQMAVEVHGGDGFDCAISMVTEAEGYSYAWFAASQNGGLVRGTLGPGDVNNAGDFFDNNFVDLFADNGDLGQFYTCTRLYEDFDDEYSQSEVILVNTFGQDTTGGSFELATASQNLPFTYTMGPNETLHFFDSIARPERILDAPLTEDPDYFWLDPQPAVEDIQCEVTTDTIGYDTLVFEFPVVVDSTILIINSQGDSLYYTIEVPTGEVETTVEYNPIVTTMEQCDTVYIHAADVLYNIPERIKVRDPYTTMFVLGLNGGLGVWMTRDALNFNTTPSWIRIADAPAGFSGTKAIEFVESGDQAGDVMFYTGWNGQVFRVSGLRNVYTQEDVDMLEIDPILSSAGAAVTGLSVDPNDPNHVVVTVGGYGATSAGKVRETFNALSENVTWTNIWSSAGFNTMPCYDVVIDATDATGETIVVGTEFGIFVTDNGGDSWAISNLGMENGPDGVTAPVFDLKQQFRESHPWSNVTNGGAIYAGTHGRGIFVNGIASDVQEEPAAEADRSWNVFPNPVSGTELHLPTQGWQGQAKVEVFDLAGRRWVNEIVNVGGVDRVTTDVQDLTSGYYVVRMSQGDSVRAAKFVVRR